MLFRAILLFTTLLLFPLAGRAEEPQATSDLEDLSLHDLLSFEVSSASKKLEPLSKTSAAMFVITQEDIRRMGAVSLPEALRMVPGLHVARIDANKWSVSSRGFSTQFSNKLLVLIDGRSVYTPLFSGVYWDAHDLVMEDIERIEVIRGPGAALWGANAVNGVINVITSKAADTKGLLVSAAGGSHEGGGAVRYGGSAGDELSYRVFAKYGNHDNFVTPSGDPANDSWDIASGGFRMDWTRDRTSFSLVGGAYGGDVASDLRQPGLAPPYVDIVRGENRTSGANVLGRWSRAFGVGNDLSVQAYFDRFERDQPALYQETRNTFDLELQHDLVAGRQDLIWGGRFRHTTDDLPSTSTLTWDPRERSDQIASLFVQDRITFGADLFKLTVGSKFEHNDYTGFEVQPNVRFAWTPGDHTLWGAVSRAVRTPARYEHTFRIGLAVVPTPQPGLVGVVTLEGNPAFVSEEVVDYEVGFRSQPLERFSFDVVGFYNDYDNLSSVEPAGVPVFVPGPTPYLQIGQTFQNLTYGSGVGWEATASVLPFDSWRLSLSHSYLRLDLSTREGSLDTIAEGSEGQFPQNQLRLQSYLDLSRGFQLDGNVHYVDELPAQGTPSYTRVDLRVSWRATERLEVALVGQNLLDDQHVEFNQAEVPVVASLIQRSVLLHFLWRQ
jgi:iron complex outermembrane receptor protein